MSKFTLHDVNSAPDASKPLLENSLQGFGMIPNLHAVLAESPQALEAYKTLTKLFLETSLSSNEKHVLWLTINVANRCHYCVPAHTMLAKKDNVPDEIITALRENRELPDAKLNALRNFALTIVEQRGEVADSDIKAFLDAGFDRRNVLDVMLGVAHKTLSNYTNHITHTPVDDAFKKFAWQSA
ncbi:MAG: carboxymuconolactone decarboxylase family protein [Gammaproteobacteria bacterium]|jgi:uncharacterized peroxidase-related enzyme|nr:carboxymuconolactone decarboxylase family protein [Gammaproteobacteria bacterium]